MSDTWDGGYEDSIDDGHEFAEKELLLPSDNLLDEEGGRASALEDPHAKKLGGGVFVAMWDGICVVCKEPFPAGDLITHKNVDGYRHAGCVGKQIFRTRYNRDESAANEFLMRNQGEEDCEDF